MMLDAAPCRAPTTSKPPGCALVPSNPSLPWIAGLDDSIGRSHLAAMRESGRSPKDQTNYGNIDHESYFV